MGADAAEADGYAGAGAEEKCPRIPDAPTTRNTFAFTCNCGFTCRLPVRHPHTAGTDAA
jgi:hypothetical protein